VHQIDADARVGDPPVKPFSKLVQAEAVDAISFAHVRVPCGLIETFESTLIFVKHNRQIELDR
jgi:hypothetical protein